MPEMNELVQALHHRVEERGNRYKSRDKELRALRYILRCDEADEALQRLQQL